MFFQQYNTNSAQKKNSSGGALIVIQRRHRNCSNSQDGQAPSGTLGLSEWCFWPFLFEVIWLVYTYPSEKYESVGMIIPNIWKYKKCSKPPIRPFLIEKKIVTQTEKMWSTNLPAKNWGCQQLLSFQASGIHETNQSCQNWLCKALRLTPVTSSHTNLLRFQCSATLAEHNKCANKPIKRTVCWKNTNWMPTNAYYPDSSVRQIVESSTVILPLHKKHTHTHTQWPCLLEFLVSQMNLLKKMGYLISSTGQLPFFPHEKKKITWGYTAYTIVYLIFTPTIRNPFVWVYL